MNLLDDLAPIPASFAVQNNFTTSKFEGELVLLQFTSHATPRFSLVALNISIGGCHMRCLYEVLGVEQDAEDGAIRSAYKKLALKWHPGECLLVEKTD